MFKAEQLGDVIADAMTAPAVEAQATMPKALTQLPRTTTPLLLSGKIRLAALRQEAHPEYAAKPITTQSQSNLKFPPGLRGLVADIAATGRGVVMAMGKGSDKLDAAGRAILEEDLRSPCTEEIAVFRAFARTIDASKDRLVVLDTAPTDHTILLLGAGEAHHREGTRTQGDMPEVVRQVPQSISPTTVTRSRSTFLEFCAR